MKKVNMFLAAVLLFVVAANAAQDTTLSQAEVRDPRQLEAIIEANASDAETRIAAVEAKAALVVNTNATIDATSVTPAFLGQMLYGSVSNRLFVATGATTNDWKEITMTAE